MRRAERVWRYSADRDMLKCCFVGDDKQQDLHEVTRSYRYYGDGIYVTCALDTLVAQMRMSKPESAFGVYVVITTSLKDEKFGVRFSTDGARFFRAVLDVNAKVVETLFEGLPIEPGVPL